MSVIGKSKRGAGLGLAALPDSNASTSKEEIQIEFDDSASNVLGGSDSGQRVEKLPNGGNLYIADTSGKSKASAVQGQHRMYAIKAEFEHLKGYISTCVFHVLT